MDNSRVPPPIPPPPPPPTPMKSRGSETRRSVGIFFILIALGLIIPAILFHLGTPDISKLDERESRSYYVNEFLSNIGLFLGGLLLIIGLLTYNWRGKTDNFKQLP